MNQPVTQPPKAPTLYEQIGGPEQIEDVIERFYDRVLHDPRIGPFFAHVPMDRLRNMQVEFFAVALDGPNRYSGRDLTDAHSQVPISRDDFSRFVSHLLDTLEDLGYDAEVVDGVVNRISLYADDVLGGFGEEG